MNGKKWYHYLEPQTTIYKWLFQLDDSLSLHGKWLFHQTSIYKWLFGFPGILFLGVKITTYRPYMFMVDFPGVLIYDSSLCRESSQKKATSTTGRRIAPTQQN